VKFKKLKSNNFIQLHVEIPKKEDYAIGLSERKKINNYGMLFNFEQENKYQGFSMKNTKINLSIAFINANKKIVDIQEMKAMDNKIYLSKHPFQYAIEAPARWFDKQKITIGDIVILPY